MQQQVTVRSVVWGLTLALLMAGINSYLTLKVGLIEEGTILVSIIFVGALAVARKRAAAHEVALTATMGSAGGSFGFIANVFAACSLSGVPLTFFQRFALPGLTGILGTLIAILMCRLYVVQHPLAWPTSKATIETITALTEREDEASQATGSQGMILLSGSMFFATIVLFSGGLHMVVPEQFLTTAFGLSQAALVGVMTSPFILCAGYLVGMRTGLGFLIGAGVLAVMSFYLPDHRAHRFLWPGVMFLVFSGFTTLALNWRVIVKAVASIFALGDDANLDVNDQVMSNRSLKIAFVVVSGLVIVLLVGSFGVPLAAAIVLMGFGFVLNLIACRAAGETAFNPIRVMAILLQGISALFGGGLASNLGAAGLAAGTVDQSGLMTQDRVFGRHFGLPARTQWLAQVAVILPMALFVAWLYGALDAATPIARDPHLAAPVARSWAAMAQIFTGQGSLPPNAIMGMVIGAVAGILLTLVEGFALKKAEIYKTSYGKFPEWLNFLPGTTGIGIALIVPPMMSITIFLGALIFLLLARRFNSRTLLAVASAGILGEGVMGVVNAILIAVGIFKRG